MANNIHLPSLDRIVLKLLMKLTSVRYQIDNPSTGKLSSHNMSPFSLFDRGGEARKMQDDQLILIYYHWIPSEYEKPAGVELRKMGTDKNP